MFGTTIYGHGPAQPIIQKLVQGGVLGVDERGRLPGHHGKEPGSRAETEREGSELVTLSFEEHSEKSPGFGVNGNVKVHVLQIDAVRPHSREKGGSDGLC